MKRHLHTAPTPHLLEQCCHLQGPTTNLQDLQVQCHQGHQNIKEGSTGVMGGHQAISPQSYTNNLHTCSSRSRSLLWLWLADALRVELVYWRMTLRASVYAVLYCSSLSVYCAASSCDNEDVQTVELYLDESLLMLVNKKLVQCLPCYCTIIGVQVL